LNRTYSSFSNQDNGTFQLQNGNTVLKLEDNAWKVTDLNYTITANTVMQLEFRSDNQGEIHGLGFESDNTLSANLIFQLHGTQNWGILDFNNYPNNGQWVSYNINVGSFYTGAADRFLFVTDHDAGPRNGDSFFRNVVIFEDANGNGVCDSSEPSALVSFGNDAPIVGNTSTEGLDLEIYPNPVKGSQLTVNTLSDTIDYKIFNMLGQLVSADRLSSSTINVSNLEAAVYIIEFSDGDQKIIKRFIKE